MGYFSNGTEGMDYEHRYCRRCVHRGDDEGPGCPVFGIHFFHNHVDVNDREKPVPSILDTFIPRKDGLWNQECRMFYPDPDPSIDQNPDAPLNLYIGPATVFPDPAATGAQE